VDLVLERLRSTPGGILVDVGTGSGAIALALASEGQAEKVIGTDVSLDALEVARANVVRCGPVLRSPVELRAGSLLGAVHERPLRAVISNPPYISWDERETLPSSVRDWEPSVALFSGADGMATTARLVRDAGAALEDGGLLALEVDVRRASLVAELVATDGAYEQVQVVLDLTGRERFVVARRQGAE
jgi:release factor glutamine methyltransferase